MVEQKLYTLKLDASWRPIEIIDANRGFSLVFSGRAQVVESYSQIACALFLYPSIIVLNDYIRRKPIDLPISRRTIIWRDGFTCQYCGCQEMISKLTIDHLIPRSRGGQKTWENLVACCIPCNQRKGDKMPSEAFMELLRKPTKPNGNFWLSSDWLMRNYKNKEIPNEWKKFLGEIK